MNAAYCDAAYLIKLQCSEHGTAEVSAHAATVDILCCFGLKRSRHQARGKLGPLREANQAMGLKPRVLQASIHGGEAIPYTQEGGNLIITIPSNNTDALCTVIELTLGKPTEAGIPSGPDSPGANP